MARRKGGRDISGWLAVDKPAGPSSNAVVGIVRRAYGARKAGHAGTLDPAATGLLAIALGEATKTVPFVTDALKCYRFTVRWGVETATDDAEGEPVATSGKRPASAEIEAVLPRYRGDIEQVPPAYSAVKIDGERAYAVARGGGEVALEPRPLRVEDLTLVSRHGDDEAEFELVCGKGGYVRAFARDIGRDLGCLGHVTTLRRIWSGPFHTDDAHPLARIEELAGDPALDDLLLPIETGLGDLPQVRCTEVAAARLAHGNPAEVIASEADYGETAWASCHGRPVAVGTYRGGLLHPTRVFHT